MNPQKEIERFYLNSFFKTMGLPAHKVKDGNDSGNEPDFFVELEEDEVGVELTRLFKSKERKGSPDKASEMQHHNEIAQLADLYYQISDIPINVQRISKKNIPAGSSLQAVALALSKMVEQISDWEESQITMGDGDGLWFCRLPKEKKPIGVGNGSPVTWDFQSPSTNECSKRQSIQSMTNWKAIDAPLNG